MKRFQSTTLLAAAATLLLSSATSALAIDKCKVKVDKRTGVILVDASGVGGPLTWGTQPSSATESFFNAGCVAGGKAKKCQLADPLTIESKTPPSGCTLYLDDTVLACSAWIPGCSPGARSDLALAAVDANDKVIGPVLDGGSFVYVYLNGPTDAVRVPLLADNSDFYSIFALFYASADCSGQELLFPLDQAVQEVVVRADTGYIFPETAAPQNYGSLLGLDPTFSNQAGCDTYYGVGNSTFTAPFGCCLVQVGNQPLAVPAATIDLSGFAPPFTLEVR